MELNLGLTPASTETVPNQTIPTGANPTEAAINTLPKQDRRSWWATLFLLCAILGAMLGLSFRTQDAKQHQETLDRAQGGEMLVKANADLQRRIAQLQKDNTQLATAVPSDTARLKLISKDLARANFLAGLTDVKGPGVIVTLNDSKLPFPKDVPLGISPPNIIHDYDIASVVNELKASGAEAISVNGQRIVAVSPVRCVGPTIMVNFTPQSPPFVIKAIGDAKTLKTGINLPGGVTKDIVSYDPTMFTTQITKQPLLIPAYDGGGTEPKFARPVSNQIADTGKKAGE